MMCQKAQEDSGFAEERKKCEISQKSYFLRFFRLKLI